MKINIENLQAHGYAVFISETEITIHKGGNEDCDLADAIRANTCNASPIIQDIIIEQAITTYNNQQILALCS